MIDVWALLGLVFAAFVAIIGFFLLLFGFARRSDARYAATARSIRELARGRSLTLDTIVEGGEVLLAGIFQRMGECMLLVVDGGAHVRLAGRLAGARDGRRAIVRGRAVRARYDAAGALPRDAATPTWTIEVDEIFRGWTLDGAQRVPAAGDPSAGTGLAIAGGIVLGVAGLLVAKILL